VTPSWERAGYPHGRQYQNQHYSLGTARPTTPVRGAAIRSLNKACHPLSPHLTRAWGSSLPPLSPRTIAPTPKLAHS
jgi:hypothetical protein